MEARLLIGTFINILNLRALTSMDSVRELENQVAELESEASRLSRALDSQKVNDESSAAASARKTEEIAKELASEVFR